MAGCSKGYLCAVCGEEVENLVDSELYLRYVMGEAPLESLGRSPDRHLRCNPTFSQFIVDPRFPPILAEGPFAKTGLDPEFVAAEEARVSAGYRRLREVSGLGIPIYDYPLIESSAGDDQAEAVAGA